jgi:hypothetical protein
MTMGVVFDHERGVRPIVVADMLCYNRSGFLDSGQTPNAKTTQYPAHMRWRWFRPLFIDE